MKKRIPTIVIIFLAAILLGFSSTSAQVNELGFHFIKVHQEKEHNKIMEGNAGSPWQYRILADYLAEPLIDLFQKINIDRPQPSAFIFFRFIQNVLIFMAAAYFYKKLGLSTYSALFGLTILAWVISQTFYDSNLSFSSYFDVLFYLLAGIFILEEKYYWLLPLIVLAAFNRETSGLIILLLPAYVFFLHPEQRKDKKIIFITLSMAFLFAGIFIGLRSFYGEQEFLTAYGNYPGFGTLYSNVFTLISWQQISITAGIMPFLAIFAYKKWPDTLKLFFWVIVPVWIVVHFFASVVAETRLFLVPLALVFIPGVLFGLSRVEPNQ